MSCAYSLGYSFKLLAIIIFTIYSFPHSVGVEDLIGFEANESYCTYLSKINCEVVESREGNGSFAVKMPINLMKPSIMYALVSGPGEISFEWKQSSSIADLVFYEENDTKSQKNCPITDILISSGKYHIDSGIHKIIWKYEFRENAGLYSTNSALTSIAWIDNIHLEGLKFYNGLQFSPDRPAVYGPDVVQVGSQYAYSAYAVDRNDDMIKYNFLWGDGSKNETDYCVPGMQSQAFHTWVIPGSYKMMVTAIDSNNGSSIPFNLTLTVSHREEKIFYPGKELDSKIKNIRHAKFYLEGRRFHKKIYIGNSTNNITINPFGGLPAHSTVIDGSGGDYCVHLLDTSNITIENMWFNSALSGIIIERCNNIKVIGNKFTNLKYGIIINQSSGIIIKDNIINLSRLDSVGIGLIYSNSTNFDRNIFRNNSFNLPENSFSISSLNCYGNEFYIDGGVKRFSEDEIECGLTGRTYRCYSNIDKRYFDLDLFKGDASADFSNSYLPGAGGSIL